MKEVINIKKEDLKKFIKEGSIYNLILENGFCLNSIFLKKYNNIKVNLIFILEENGKFYRFLLDGKYKEVEELLKFKNIKANVQTLRGLLLLGYNIDKIFNSLEVLLAKGMYFGIENYIENLDKAKVSISNEISELSMKLPYSFKNYDSFVSSTSKFFLKEKCSENSNLDFLSILCDIDFKDKENLNDIDKIIKRIFVLYNNLDKIQKVFNEGVINYSLIDSISSIIDLKVNKSKEYLMSFNLRDLGLLHYEYVKNGHIYSEGFEDRVIEREGLSRYIGGREIKNKLSYLSILFSSCFFESVEESSQELFWKKFGINNKMVEDIKGSFCDKRYYSSPNIIIKRILISLSKKLKGNSITLWKSRLGVFSFKISNNIHPSVAYDIISKAIESVVPNCIENTFISTKDKEAYMGSKSKELIYNKEFYKYLEEVHSSKFENVEVDVSKLYKEFKK